jgi:hypothetical protein
MVDRLNRLMATGGLKIHGRLAPDRWTFSASATQLLRTLRQPQLGACPISKSNDDKVLTMFG